MVAAVACAILIASAAAGAQNAPATPVLSAWAVQARAEGRETKSFDPKLAPVRRVLEGLPFDNFTCLGDFSQPVPMNQEVEIPISGRHTLFLKPRERLADGRLLLDLRVEMPSRELRGKPVTALKAELKIIPGELLNVRGFHVEEGELIIVLRAEFSK